MSEEGMLDNSMWIGSQESKKTKVYGLLYEHVDVKDMDAKKVAEIFRNLTDYKPKCRAIPIDVIIDHYKLDESTVHIYLVIRFNRRVTIKDPSSFSIDGYIPRVWTGSIPNKIGDRVWVDELTYDIRFVNRKGLSALGSTTHITYKHEVDDESSVCLDDSSRDDGVGINTKSVPKRTRRNDNYNVKVTPKGSRYDDDNVPCTRYGTKPIEHSEREDHKTSDEQLNSSGDDVPESSSNNMNDAKSSSPVIDNLEVGNSTMSEDSSELNYDTDSRSSSRDSVGDRNPHPTASPNRVNSKVIDLTSRPFPSIPINRNSAKSKSNRDLTPSTNYIETDSMCECFWTKRHRIIIGPEVGKTSWAKYLLDYRCLIVENFSDLRKFDVDEHDGIIFENLNLDGSHHMVIKRLLSYDDIILRFKDKDVHIPHSTRLIFTTRMNDGMIFGKAKHSMKYYKECFMIRLKSNTYREDDSESETSITIYDQ